MERGRIEGLPKFFEYPQLSQERIKLRTSNFVSIGTKALYNISGKVAEGVCEELSKLFRTPIYWAHRAVVFAIARLSCSGGLRKTHLFRKGTYRPFKVIKGH